MKSIRNYNLSDIHLFEVSILGEGRLWRAGGEDYLIIPCYRMELRDGRILGYSYHFPMTKNEPVIHSSGRCSKAKAANVKFL